MRARQRGHVARGGDLALVGEAGGVVEVRGGEAERARLRIHARRERALRAGDGLRHDHRDVVRRAHADRQDRVAHRDRLPALQAELRRRHARGVPRDAKRRVERKPPRPHLLEEEIERHHLGERSGMADGVGVLRVKHVAGADIDHDAGVARVRLRPRLGKRQRRHVDGRCAAGRRAGGEREREKDREPREETHRRQPNGRS